MRRSLAIVAFLIAACSRTPEPVGTAEARTEAPCLRQLSSTPPQEVKSVPPEKCPKDPEFTTPLRTGEMTLPTQDGGSTKLTVELALTQDEHSKGLMYRTSMPEDHGMLFVMERKVQHFWMRNTCLALDMLFIDTDGTISGVLENVPTLNEEERTVGCPTPYVLEVNAGWVRRHGVRPGTKVSLPKH